MTGTESHYLQSGRGQGQDDARPGSVPRTPPTYYWW